jgi:hypothetical protein
LNRKKIAAASTSAVEMATRLVVSVETAGSPIIPDANLADRSSPEMDRMTTHG